MKTQILLLSFGTPSSEEKDLTFAATMRGGVLNTNEQRADLMTLSTTSKRLNTV